MDEKENIIKYYSKTGESLTNLTGISFGHSCWRNRQRFRLIKIFD